MRANIPANCINTNGLFAPGVHGVVWRLSKARERANCKCAYHDRESWSTGHGRVSRGNKFRQIVLPALYTVAHEVERSMPPASHPRDRCPPSPPAVTASAFQCGYVHPWLLWVRETCALCPRNENVAISFPLSSSLLPIASLRLSSAPCPPSSRVLALLILSLARYQPPSLYSANVFPIFLLRSTCTPAWSQRPSIAALACGNASAPRFFSALSSALIPTCSIGWFHRFSPIEIDACLFASLSPRALSPIQFPRPLHPSCQILSFDLPFRRASPRRCAWFSLVLPIFVPLPTCASTCVHLRINPSSLFSRVTLSRLSSHPYSFVTIRVLPSCLASRLSQLIYQFFIAFSFISVLIINILSC